MHPRISVSAVSSYRNTLDQDLVLWQQLGVRRVGLTLAKLAGPGVDVATQRVKDAGLDVTNVITFGPSLEHPDTWPARLDCLQQAVDVVLALGADHVVITTGPAGALPWDEAVDRLRTFLQPLAAHRDRIIIEHTNSLRVDVGFVHTLRDVVDLARCLGVGVLCELNACWSERAVDATIRDGIEVIRLVQVSDFVVGTHDTPNRVVPGDGDVPLGRLVGQLCAAGYGGDFDLELIGPRIEAEGYESAVRRGLDVLTALLTAHADG